MNARVEPLKDPRWVKTTSPGKTCDYMRLDIARSYSIEVVYSHNPSSPKDLGHNVKLFHVGRMIYCGSICLEQASCEEVCEQALRQVANHLLNEEMNLAKLRNAIENMSQPIQS